jgi:hypothetical protein
MDQLRPGFEAGDIKAFDVRTWPLERGVEAYQAADQGGPAVKHILLPS